MKQGKAGPRVRGGKMDASQAQRLAIEALIDDIGAQSFPASDPPAWGVVSSRLEEASRASPPPRPRGWPSGPMKPRASKQEFGGGNPPPVPTYIRAEGVELEPDDRVYIRRKLGRKLGKFGSSVERISVRLEDVNGPRGGVDHQCRIKVVLSGRPSVVYEQRGASFRVVIDRAIAGAERAVRRSLLRRRMAPIKKRARAGPTVAAG
jgi:sigma 54 modulation/S30EA-like ribosomal protein